MTRFNKHAIENSGFLYKIGSDRPIALINNEFAPALLKELRQNFPLSKGEAKRKNNLGHEMNFIAGWNDPFTVEINEDIINHSTFGAFLPMQCGEIIVGYCLNYEDMTLLETMAANALCKVFDVSNNQLVLGGYGLAGKFIDLVIPFETADFNLYDIVLNKGVGDNEINIKLGASVNNVYPSVVFGQIMLLESIHFKGKNMNLFKIHGKNVATEFVHESLASVSYYGNENQFVKCIAKNDRENHTRLSLDDLLADQSRYRLTHV
jgi:hypothetical protein